MGASSASIAWPYSMNTTASARARSMKITRCAWTPGRPGGVAEGATLRDRASVRHRVEQDVDADGVAVGRELVEETRIVTFPFPGIGHVGVVRHHHHDSSVPVANHAEVRIDAVGAALGGVGAARGAPECDVRDLRDLRDRELRLEDRIVQR